ncbi:hypothetical protein SOVF_112780 [Spinacia oleracea]|nr:hypothetical protein SOVF_112780 [Spinacia oleracea]
MATRKATLNLFFLACILSYSVSPWQRMLISLSS